MKKDKIKVLQLVKNNKFLKSDITTTGFTDSEQEVMDALLLAGNKYNELDQEMPGEKAEFAHYIHILINKLAMRIVRRDYPKSWPKFKEIE